MGLVDRIMAEWWMGEGCEESGEVRKLILKNPRNKIKKKKRTPHMSKMFANVKNAKNPS